MTHYSYKERLAFLDLDSLEKRRLKYDLTTTYKILFGLIDIDIDKFFKLCPSKITRGHNYKLIMPKSQCNTRRYFYSLRVVNAWNSLRKDKTDFLNLASFKKSIKNADFNKFISF
jgi:hypothetical protein